MIKHISVKQNHIDRGNSISTSCPVALAILEVCPNSQPHVYGKDIIFAFGDRDFNVKAPDPVGTWVYAYDYKGFAQPFEFDLDIPDAVACDD